MRRLARLLTGLALVLSQIVIATSMQSEAAPIVLPLIITFFYSGWCDSYILGFAVSSLSFMAYFLAVAIWYGVHNGISSFFSTLQPAFTAWQFYILVTTFGLLGVISVKIGRWLRRHSQKLNKPAQ